MYLPNLKFVALPVPEIIGVLKKSDSPFIRPRSLFSQIFNGLSLLFGWTQPWMDPANVSAKFAVRVISRENNA